MDSHLDSSLGTALHQNRSVRNCKSSAFPSFFYKSFFWSTISCFSRWESPSSFLPFGYTQQMSRHLRLFEYFNDLVPSEIIKQRPAIPGLFSAGSCPAVCTCCYSFLSLEGTYSSPRDPGAHNLFTAPGI